MRRSEEDIRYKGYRLTHCTRRQLRACIVELVSFLEQDALLMSKVSHGYITGDKDTVKEAVNRKARKEQSNG